MGRCRGWLEAQQLRCPLLESPWAFLTRSPISTRDFRGMELVATAVQQVLMLSESHAGLQWSWTRSLISTAVFVELGALVQAVQRVRAASDSHFALVWR